MSLLLLLMLIYACFVVGLYIKLLDYGAPKSSILYAWLLPLITISCFAIIAYENAKGQNYNLVKTISKVFRTLIKVLFNLNYLCGLLCVFFATHQIGVRIVFELDFRHIGNTIQGLIDKFILNLPTYKNDNTMNELLR